MSQQKMLCPKKAAWILPHSTEIKPWYSANIDVAWPADYKRDQFVAWNYWPYPFPRIPYCPCRHHRRARRIMIRLRDQLIPALQRHLAPEVAALKQAMAAK